MSKPSREIMCSILPPFVWFSLPLFRYVAPERVIMFAHEVATMPFADLWSAPRTKTPGQKSAIHRLIVKSGKSDRLKIQNENSAHAKNIGSG